MLSIRIFIYLILCVSFILGHQYIITYLGGDLWLPIIYFLLVFPIVLSFLNVFICVFYKLDLNKVNGIRHFCLWRIRSTKNENVKLVGIFSLLAAFSVLAIPFGALTIYIDLKKEEISLADDLKKTESKIQKLERSRNEKSDGGIKL